MYFTTQGQVRRNNLCILQYLYKTQNHDIFQNWNQSNLIQLIVWFFSESAVSELSTKQMTFNLTHMVCHDQEEFQDIIFPLEGVYSGV